MHFGFLETIRSYFVPILNHLLKGNHQKRTITVPIYIGQKHITMKWIHSFDFIL